jgi:hypothetical protein
MDTEHEREKNNKKQNQIKHLRSDLGGQEK